MLSGLRARNPLPEGTPAIAIGLGVAGLAQYAFLAIGYRALGRNAYAALATFWSMLFILGPGFFLPLEQEVGRALAERRTRDQGGGPVVRRALAAGGLLCAGLLVIMAALSGILANHFFHGEALFVAALGTGLVAYTCVHTTRGTLSGNGRFSSYGLLLGSEGILRCAGCGLCAVIGSRVAGLFGFALVLASFVAIPLALSREHGLLRPGPVASWRVLSNALGFLLLASVATYFLLSAGPVVIPLLERSDQTAAAGQFLNARVVAFIPFFLFQAVQAALLPKLATLAATSRVGEFRRVLSRLLAATATLGMVTTAGGFLLGPLAVRILFGADATLGGRDLALLSFSCAGFMLASALGQALVSLGRYSSVALGWVAGALGFGVVTALGSDLFLRVELGLVAGATGPAVILGVLLLRALPAMQPIGSIHEVAAIVLPEIADSVR